MSARKPRKSAQSIEQKLQTAVSAISECGFRSPNEFIKSYYASEEYSQQSLRYVEDFSFAPREILDSWVSLAPSRESRNALKTAITAKAAEFMVEESTTALSYRKLQVVTSAVTVALLMKNFGLETICSTYMELLPSLWAMLFTLLTARNTYETKHNTDKQGKFSRAGKIVVVIISMLLYFRNRNTSAFPLIIGIFLASTGASRRVIDTFHHMALSSSYLSVQKALEALTTDATTQARNFVQKSDRLWGVVYDNINFMLRAASQRLDSTTRQVNATTLAVFAFPAMFTWEAYKSTLSVSEKNKKRGLRCNLDVQSLRPGPEKQQHIIAAFEYAVGTILLDYVPGKLQNQKRKRKIRNALAVSKPILRKLGHEKTEFFPLPAVNEEESSVSGTMKVIKLIFNGLLGLGGEMVATQCLFRTHLGTATQANPSSLEHHRTLLRRAKLDLKKPEYNRAQELTNHSLAARLIDCIRIVLGNKTFDDVKEWKPSRVEFKTAVARIVRDFASSAAAGDALSAQDEVMAHSILFIRDALIFWEFCDAVRDADVGRMWAVYDFWVYMFRGAGCHNYANELLDMKGQFGFEFPQLLQDVVERTWLVNRWGEPGRSIPTDLYLEHNNNFINNMFTALGSCASIEYIQEKGSASVEVLRSFVHQIVMWFGATDLNRRHKEVSVSADIAALCEDIIIQGLHTTKPNRTIGAAATSRTPAALRPKVKDVLAEGMRMLGNGCKSNEWKKRAQMETLGFMGLGEDHDSDPVLDLDIIETCFSDPNGAMDVDTALDPEFSSEDPNEDVVDEDDE
ncbi:hypothetical protein FA15DRAFT_697632 [Coprinopsis marcescibilis]|uniref:DUF6589 domain-containing protein n=1 Tax=Coprinopsis marcescibilis TaxID=230819 RepID=A0A5C3KGW0_COPMA|nr:hypothetical protein FA15DRAFT_697632 [Coprinopsis marcescibilis]